ncbi:hypothetical protein [Ruegeria sp. Ofav3-42]|uniref:hypothetical protein n=1 Tax=Ruegeria sp. Ofav3-42 TaxID=2917759 RepID=UPI001EF45CB3|nr:hypothetical protein [Ruegeria sp. Ofav3-42]MCG7521885.1 hypothetical protein [Ruegeria sp. Ofav3-42]
MTANRKKRIRRSLIWFLVLLAVVIALVIALSTPGSAEMLYFGTVGLILPILWLLLFVLAVMGLRLVILVSPRAGGAIVVVAAIIVTVYFAAPGIRTKYLVAKHVAQLEQIEPKPIDSTGISGIEMNWLSSRPIPYVENTIELLESNKCNVYCFDLLRSGGAEWVRLIAPVGPNPLGLDETPNRIVFAWGETAECRKFHPTYPTGEGCLIIRRDTGANADLVVSQRVEENPISSSANSRLSNFGRTHLRVTDAYDASGMLLFRRQQIIYRPKNSHLPPMGLGNERFRNAIAPAIDINTDLSSLGFSMSGSSGFSWPLTAPNDTLKRAGYLVLVRSMLDAHEGPFGVGEKNQFELNIVADWTSFIDHAGIEFEVENATLCRILAEPTAAKNSRFFPSATRPDEQPCPITD